jgi:hypothetical protein
MNICIQNLICDDTAANYNKNDFSSNDNNINSSGDIKNYNKNSNNSNDNYRKFVNIENFQNIKTKLMCHI